MLRPALAACIAAALPGICVTDAVAQEPAGSGTFSMESEPGDFVGAGLKYDYSGTTVRVTVRGTRVAISVNGPEQWSLMVGAPDDRRLEPRTYDVVARIAGPGQATLDLGGEGRSCNVTHGFFTVHDVDYSALGYVESIHVSFEQRCEKPTAPALRGEARVDAPPPPDPLKIELGFDPERTTLDAATGAVVLRGTIRCSQPVTTYVAADVEEIGRAGATFGSAQTNVASCSSTRGWELSVHRSDGQAYSGGDITARLRTDAIDDWWTAYKNGELVRASDEITARAEVAAPEPSVAAEQPPAGDLGSDEDSGVLGMNTTASLIVGLGALLLAMLVTAAATWAVTRRRYRPPRA